MYVTIIYLILTWNLLITLFCFVVDFQVLLHSVYWYLTGTADSLGHKLCMMPIRRTLKNVVKNYSDAQIKVCIGITVDDNWLFSAR